VATELLYAASVASGSCTSSANAYGATNGTYTGDTDNTNWTCRWNLDPLTTGTLSTGTNAQSVSIRTRKQTGTGTPSYVLNVYEGGSLVYTSGSTNVTSASSQDDVFTWTATGTDGSDIDMELVVTSVGGKPAARATVQVDAFTLTADYALPTYNFSGVVTGAIPALAGTVAATRATSGTIAGDFTLAGTAPGSKATTGTATGAVPTLAGTVTGTAALASNDVSGTVTGDFLLAGTAPGTKATTGTVVGDFTLTGTADGLEGRTTTVVGDFTATGTVTGTRGATGAVAGSVTLDGTATATSARTGTVAGSAAISGTVSGTAYDPTAPTPEPAQNRGGGGARRHYRYAQIQQDEPAPESHAGRASGHLAVAGQARGARATRSRLCAATEIRATTTGTKSTRGLALAHITTRAHAVGLRRAGTPTEQERRKRDEDDLLLLIKETL